MEPQDKIITSFCESKLVDFVMSVSSNIKYITDKEAITSRKDLTHFPSP